MKRIKISILILTLSLASFISPGYIMTYTGVLVEVTSDFIDVENAVNRKVAQYGKSEVLVVLDIDNTLLTSAVGLGGEFWYQWQQGELDIKPGENQKVKCLFNDAIGLLYELGTMSLTDPRVPGYINEWQQAGITVFALTSRDPRTRTATERELIKNGIDFSKRPLKGDDGELPVLRYTLQREMSYMKGIMMTAGMDKGLMLKHLLEKTGRSFKAVIFVDDSEKNVENMKNAWEGDISTDISIFRYNRIAEDRKASNGGVIISQKQANRLDRDWKRLNRTLNRIFPGRRNNGDCVSPY